MVDYVKLKPRLRTAVVRVTTTDKLILSAAHGNKPPVCSPNNAVEIGRLDIGFKHYFFLFGNGAARNVGKRLYGTPFFLGVTQAHRPLFNFVTGCGVGAYSRGYAVAGKGFALFLGFECRFSVGQGGYIDVGFRL